MTIFNGREPLIFLVGDLVAIVLALLLTLLLRYQGLPDEAVIMSHWSAFSVLFAVWIVVFFIAGLYEKHTVVLRDKLPGIILKTQLVNSVIAIAFFYFVPYFGITPKTNLFIDLVFSFILLLIWRLIGVDALGVRRRQGAITIGSGREMFELVEEINHNPRYRIFFDTVIDVSSLDPRAVKERLERRLSLTRPSLVALALENQQVEKLVPNLYQLVFLGVSFIDINRLYESVFDKIPLSFVGYRWFLENLPTAPTQFYDGLKRLMDITVSIILGVLSLFLYPVVWLAILLDDGGPLFIFQERVGKNHQRINICKFRTMSDEKKGLSPEERITRVGRFLRKTRVDELPQLYNVIRGDLSLIGPRPELPALVFSYEQQIPYYRIRHMIKPGLSGWAQIVQATPPKFTEAVEATRMKLSYDLYYIKNRSITLDVKIALRTIVTLLSRSGI
jgi:lipopolysaccharide/colanic/teichoic acid biosynthesis glycosyltransferase